MNSSLTLVRKERMSASHPRRRRPVRRPSGEELSSPLLEGELAEPPSEASSSSPLPRREGRPLAVVDCRLMPATCSATLVRRAWVG